MVHCREEGTRKRFSLRVQALMNRSACGEGLASVRGGEGRASVRVVGGEGGREVERRAGAA